MTFVVKFVWTIWEFSRILIIVAGSLLFLEEVVAMQVRVESHSRMMMSNDLLVRAWYAMALVALVFLVIGTFADLVINQSISYVNSSLVVWLSTIGLCPITLPLCVIFGAFGRCVSGPRSDGFRWSVGFALSQAGGIALGCLFMRALVSIEGLGPFLSTRVPDWMLFLFGVPIGCSLSSIGYTSLYEPSDVLGRKLGVVIFTLVMSFVVVELIKHVMLRPRYRTLLLGNEGVVFYPWYARCDLAKSFMSDYGISANGFQSFPSAHALQVASLLTSYYGLCLIWPQLNKFWTHVVVATFSLVIVVSICRLLLGAHFLSDVAVGILVASLFGLWMYRLQKTDFCTYA